ncbi:MULTISPECIES: hypothetical protein [unclassified Sphingobium]|uniref:hypothetical protein n=1 Tax=unclassified Sphingobium TaxID=2611147 RepID=UPI0035A6CDF8
MALFVPLAPLDAQHPMILARLNEWNAAAPVPADEILKTEIRGEAGEIYGGKADCNSSDIAIDTIEPATADRYAFNAILRKALRNAWFVTAKLPGCEQAPMRFMVLQNADNSLRTVRVNRGISYAWDSLIGDTLPAAQLAATIALERAGVTCSSNEKTILGVTRIAVGEASVGKNVFGIRYSGSWTEVWPIEACKRTVEVSIKFTADGDGGAFTQILGDKTRILS